MPLTISVIVCAYNEERLLPACLATLSRQSRPPDEIVVVNNASTDGTRAIAASTPGVKVVDEPRKGLVIARETGRRHARGELLAFLDADCQAPGTWLERVEAEFGRRSRPAAVTGCYRFHDWDFTGRLLIRLYDYTLAPATHFLAQRVLRMGAVLYGGNFTVHRDALEAIGGFDTTIEFHGEDTNVGRRLAKVGTVVLSPRCFIYTSARRYKAMGRIRVLWLYTSNFAAEIFRHRPGDITHEDIRN